MRGSGATAGALLLAIGVCCLKLSWRKRQGFKAHLVFGGWLLIVGGFMLLSRVWGAEVGTSYAALGLTLAAYAIIAAGVELRTAPARAQREAALEPEERQTSWARGVAKSLLAIVLSGVASIGVGVAFAVSMPMVVHDRILIGGILVPVLWGAGMAWTLSDSKLMRATILLLSVSAASYAIAFLPKVFA